jgi:hypothetical protein
MCTELLPPGGYPTAVNKYIISYNIVTLKSAVVIQWLVLSAPKDGCVVVCSTLQVNTSSVQELEPLLEKKGKWRKQPILNQFSAGNFMFQG